MPPKKKFYTDLGSVLILLSTFAGAVTLSTQFTVPDDCAHSRARALLAFASQFFLVCPIGLFTIFMCLHGFEDHHVIEPGRHVFIRCQFAFVGIMLCAGFLLLNISILYTGAEYLGPSGAALTGLFILSTIFWSVEAHLPGGREVPAPPPVEVELTGPEDSVKGFLGVGGLNGELPVAKKAMRWLIYGVLGLEGVGILVLLGMGITQAVIVRRPGGGVICCSCVFLSLSIVFKWTI